MAVAGTLTVNVTAGTSDFKRDIAEATGSIKGFGEVHSSTMRESVGGVRLLTHELGVPLPRELARLVASIPAVGAAFSMMLPIIGVVAAVAVIGKLIKSHEEAKEKALEQRDAWSALNEKIQDGSDQLQVANDKLNNAIATYEGKPKNNVKLALDEAVVSANKLFMGLSNDISELEKLMGKQDASLLEKVLGGSAADDMREALETVKRVSEEGDAAVRAARDSNDVKKVQTAETLACANNQKALNDAINHGNELYNKANEAKKQYEENPSDEMFISMGALDQRMGNLGNTVKILHSRLDEAKVGGDHLAASLTVALEDPAHSAHNLAEAIAKLARDNKSIVSEMKTSWEDLFEPYSGDRKEAKKYSEEAAKADEEEISHIRETNEENKKTASSLQAVAKSKHEVAMIHIDDDVKSGNTSKIDEQAEKKKILEGEHQDLVDAHASDIAEEQRYVDALNAAAQLMPDGEARIKALHDVTEAQSQLNEMNAKYNIELAKNESAQKSCDIEQKRLSGDFKQWIKDMQHDMPSTTAMLEKDFSKAFDGMNSAMAKTLVEGKNFGKAMKQVGAELLESVIEQELKKLEVYLLSLIHKKSATVAGDAAQIAAATATAAAIKPTLASMSAVAAFESVMEAEPYPDNTLDAPLQAVIAFGEAMAFAKGGLVPGYGNYDSVPAMLTPGESVVTKALTQQVENSQGGSSNQGHTVHIHMGDVHAVDAKGFDGLLEKHAAVVGKHVQSQMRRMHRKVN